MARYLFLSFQGCIKGLAHGKITEDDLRQALFAFDCPEIWAYCPPQGTLTYYTGITNEDRLRVLHFRLLEHLKVAEYQGRCAYRGQREHDTWVQMRAFLERNGFPGLPVPDNDGWAHAYVSAEFLEICPKVFGDNLLLVTKNWEGVEPHN